MSDSPIEELREEIRAVRQGLFILEQRVELIESETSKIPGIEMRTVHTELRSLHTDKVVMEIQKEMRADIKALTKKQDELNSTLTGRLDMILDRLQPRVVA